MERKTWTPEEDRVLQEIIEVRQMKKWSSIARCMEADYKLQGRTGKQCRQRWYNQLSPSINNSDWKPEEEIKLFESHKELGNRWTKIANRLPGRTDNSVKNHYYSTLRKGMRKLNNFILATHPKVSAKLMNNVQLSKVMIVADDKFQRKLPIPERLRDLSQQITNRLIDLSREKSDLDAKFQELMNKVYYFCQHYRIRRPKKKKKKDDDEQQQKDEFLAPTKPRIRRNRSFLQCLEADRSCDYQEMPNDFPSELFQNGAFRSPCSPLNFENALVTPTPSFVVSQSFEMEPLMLNKAVSLEASTGTFSPIGFIWSQRFGFENFEMPRPEIMLLDTINK